MATLSSKLWVPFASSPSLRQQTQPYISHPPNTFLTLCILGGIFQMRCFKQDTVLAEICPMLNTVALVCLNICKNILPLIRALFPLTSFAIDLLSLIIFPCHFTRLWKFCDTGLNIFIMTKPIKLLVTCWQASLHRLLPGSHLRFPGDLRVDVMVFGEGPFCCISWIALQPVGRISLSSEDLATFYRETR